MDMKVANALGYNLFKFLSDSEADVQVNPF